ncbi:voltage-gated purine nucleotide uniporter SLC17A9 [Hetaerina americana]|uniref:voltage-gated purine nucleotide uniporter SLC17A9 n=1 Tax=Hetaerina americana TaxID=62018 RepID=UPI003A7F524E
MMTKEIESNTKDDSTPFFQDDHIIWTRSERKRWLIILLVGTMALYSSRTSLPLVMPAVTEERMWSKTDSGTILSSFFWGYTLTQVIGGYLSDRMGGEKIILTAAVGWSLLTFWMPQIIRMIKDPHISVKFIALTRVIHGALQGVHFPSMSSLSSQHLLEKERAPFFSVLTCGSAMGTLITGTLGSQCLEYYGWPSVFHILGFLGVIWTLSFVRFSPKAERIRKKLIRKKFQRHLQYCPVLLGKDHMDQLCICKEAVPWMQIIKEPAFWSCVICHACHNNCYFILLSWLPTYFHDTFPAAKGWIFNVVPWLFPIPATFLGKWLSEKLITGGYSITSTRKIVESLCLSVEAVALCLIAGISSFHYSLMCMTIILAASGLHSNAVVVNPQDLAPKHSGIVFGLMNTFGAIPGFAGVYLAGFILETTKSWAAVFQATAVINVIGGLLFAAFGSGEAIV